MGSDTLAIAYIKMRKFLTISIFTFISSFAFSQYENVELNNNIYDFLNRLHIKKIISKYSNAVLPLNRLEIANYLKYIDEFSSELNEIEKKKLDEYKREFEYELTNSLSSKTELFQSGSFTSNFLNLFSDKERFIYTYIDSSITFFANALFESKSMIAIGDYYDNKHSSLLRWGGKIRGTIGNKIGYYAFATNGQIIDDKNLGLTDITLKNNYKIHEHNSKNFDFTEGYITYNTHNITFQFGREKVSYGQGYNEKMQLSSVNAIDFIKLNFHLASINYAFIHSWILPKSQYIKNNQLMYNDEPINSKYLAIHRLGITLLDNNLELGASEMVVYSNRPFEIAYITPLIFYKSVEHSLQDRDNSLLSFDASVRLIPKVKLYGTFVIDDIDFSKIGTKWWGNLFSYQVGTFITEPFGLSNLDFNIEYLKILPYTFSHRFIENNYTNYNSYVGPNLDPNSDKLDIFSKYYLTYRTSFQIGFSYIRHGKNIVDDKGNVIKNVGGDINFGHRSIDSEETEFLDGKVEKIFTPSFRLLYEVFNDIFFSFEYSYYISKEDIKSKQQMINLIFSINY